MFNPEIFKAYDLRGIFNQDFRADFAYKLGLAFVALRKKDDDSKSNKLKIVVARDMRLSSLEISKELIRGLQAAGVHVLDAGLLSTPAFYFAVSHSQADGGIIVSASHNPKEWNGFKLVRSKAKPISGETGINWLKENINRVKETLEEKDFLAVTKLENMAEEQFKHDLQYINPIIKDFKIVADAANSMGAQYLELLEKNIPGELIKMNFELDGSFPSHEADPLKKENLLTLQKKVLEERADLGIATDGDGDRVFFLDNLGKIIDPSIIRGLLAKIFLIDKPGSKICYDVRPGKITRDLIIKHGGIPIITRVGHSLIKDQMLKEGAYFAGESSGHFFLNLDIGCFEMPVIMIGKMLELFGQQKTTISEFIKQYEVYYHSGEINRSVNDKEKVFLILKERFRDAKLSLLDGVSVEYDNYWFNVRGSNTENKVRLNLEAVDLKTMEINRDKIIKIIESC
ncbi:MAG: phosphomannomutase/phosphoglucomutase [Clostridia bacterium]|nr:phosphomannomutase/phosphoglucomutase [Clostridia bacterium]